MPKEIPRVDWPEEDGNYKVVQLYADRKPFLIFAPTRIYHKYILEVSLRSLGIKFDIEEEKGGYKKAARKGKNYKAVGMGMSEVNVNEKKASFFGMSSDYRIGINLKHLKKIIKLEKDWNLEIVKYND